MLAKNKAQKAKNRRKNKTDSEEINDWDNKISIIISEMKNVAAVFNKFYFFIWAHFGFE